MLMTRVSFRREKEDEVSLGFSASSSSRDVLGDADMGVRPMPMEEVPPVLPPTEPPHAMDLSSETDAMMLAAVHPYGHEEPVEVSRTEFESTVREGSYVEEDTLEYLLTEKVVEGMNRELDLMKSRVSGSPAS